MTLATQIPGLTIEEEREDFVRIAVEPLPRGFAHTAGNSLRRVLLSGIAGTAITSVRIDQVQHEFSWVPQMEEDTTQFLLNLREVRIHALADRPAEMHLNVSGSRVVTAGDITVPGDYKIVNPELHLARLSGDDARLDVVMNVETGYGFQPSQRNENTEQVSGVIPLDAVFTPVRKVFYEVANATGAGSEFEQLILEVWTDRTISGIDAVQSAARSLRSGLELFETMGQPITTRQQLAPHAAVGLSAEQYDMDIEKLELSVRALNCLRRSHITKVGHVLEKSGDDLLTLRNFGEKSYVELIEKLLELELIDPEDPRVRRAQDGVYTPDGDDVLTTLPPQSADPAGGVSLSDLSSDEPELAVGGSESDEAEPQGAIGAALLEAMRRSGSDSNEDDA